MRGLWRATGGGSAWERVDMKTCARSRPRSSGGLWVSISMARYSGDVTWGRSGTNDPAPIRTPIAAKNCRHRTRFAPHVHTPRVCVLTIQRDREAEREGERWTRMRANATHARMHTRTHSCAGFQYTSVHRRGYLEYYKIISNSIQIILILLKFPWCVH